MQTNVITFPKQSKVIERQHLIHDKELLELRHELNTVYLNRLMENHTPGELEHIIQVHRVANSVTSKEHKCVLEGAIRDLKELDPNFVPFFRQSKH